MAESLARRTRTSGTIIANLLAIACFAVLGPSAAAASIGSGSHESPTAAAASIGSGPHRTPTAREWRSVRRHMRDARHSRQKARMKLHRCLRRHPYAPTRCDVKLAALKVARRRVQIVRARKRRDGARIAAFEERLAPHVAASGDTVKWNKVQKVDDYVFVRRLPGGGNTYSVVHGTSVTPPPMSGATVRYSVRTAVHGSKWAPEVAIAYPQSGTKAHTKGGGAGGGANGGQGSGSSPPPTTSTTTSSTEGAPVKFELGMIPETLSSEEPSIIAGLGARTVRMEFEIDDPVSDLEPIVTQYAQAGIRVLPLAGFEGRLPSVQEAQNLGKWAAAFGPGGTFWQGKSYPGSVAITDVEFGNETSYSYQWSDNSTQAVASRAQTYAQRFQSAYESMHSANSQVGLLAQADDGDSGSSTWVESMFAAVPSLGQIVAGWTIHPYGPEWETRINRLISQTSAVGAPSTVPIYVTEWGLATDNGSCLTDNYGWNPCMTYSEAATVVRETIDGMRSRYGSRLAAVYLYQAQDQAPAGASNNREEYFGVLQNDDAPKGAYTTAVESLLAESP